MTTTRLFIVRGLKDENDADAAATSGIAFLRNYTPIKLEKMSESCLRRLVRRVAVPHTHRIGLLRLDGCSIIQKAPDGFCMFFGAFLRSTDSLNVRRRSWTMVKCIANQAAKPQTTTTCSPINDDDHHRRLSHQYRFPGSRICLRLAMNLIIIFKLQMVHLQLANLASYLVACSDYRNTQYKCLDGRVLWTSCLIWTHSRWVGDSLTGSLPAKHS